MKYIINVPTDRVKDGRLRVLIDVENGVTRYIGTGISVKPYTKPDRQDVENEVWEFVRKLSCMTYEEAKGCFGTGYEGGYDVLACLTYSKAKAKYEAWRKQEDEIRVGDEVYSKTSKWRGVVTDIDDGDLTILDGSGQTACHYNPKYFGKTGKHFDSIKNLLDGLKEN